MVVMGWRAWDQTGTGGDELLLGGKGNEIITLQHRSEW